MENLAIVRLFCQGSVRVLPLVLPLIATCIWIVSIDVEAFEVLHFLVGNVDQVVRRSVRVASVGVAQDLLLFDSGHCVIVVLPPDVLPVIPDVAVVVTTLSGAFVNAHPVQMVRHALQRLLVQAVQVVLMLAYLAFEIAYLLLDLVAVLIQRLLNHVRLIGSD